MDGKGWRKKQLCFFTQLSIQEGVNSKPWRWNESLSGSSHISPSSSLHFLPSVPSQAALTQTNDRLPSSSSSCSPHFSHLFLAGHFIWDVPVIYIRCIAFGKSFESDTVCNYGGIKGVSAAAAADDDDGNNPHWATCSIRERSWDGLDMLVRIHTEEEGGGGVWFGLAWFGLVLSC